MNKKLTIISICVVSLFLGKESCFGGSRPGSRQGFGSGDTSGTILSDSFNPYRKHDRRIRSGRNVGLSPVLGYISSSPTAFSPASSVGPPSPSGPLSLLRGAPALPLLAPARPSNAALAEAQKRARDEFEAKERADTLRLQALDNPAVFEYQRNSELLAQVENNEQKLNKQIQFLREQSNPDSIVMADIQERVVSKQRALAELQQAVDIPAAEEFFRQHQQGGVVWMDGRAIDEQEMNSMKAEWQEEKAKLESQLENATQTLAQAKNNPGYRKELANNVPRIARKITSAQQQIADLEERKRLNREMVEQQLQKSTARLSGLGISLPRAP